MAKHDNSQNDSFRPVAGQNQASRRQEKVAQQVQQALAELITRERHHLDLPVAALTITGVRMTPDLRSAIVGVVPLGGQLEGIDGLVKALQEQAAYLQKLLGQRLHLKFTPRLQFRADKGLEARWRLEKALDSEKVRRDTKKTGE